MSEEEFINKVEETFSPMDIFKSIVYLSTLEKVPNKENDYYCKKLNEILRIKCENIRRINNANI